MPMQHIGKIPPIYIGNICSGKSLYANVLHGVFGSSCFKPALLGLFMMDG